MGVEEGFRAHVRAIQLPSLAMRLSTAVVLALKRGIVPAVVVHIAVCARLTGACRTKAGPNRYVFTQAGGAQCCAPDAEILNDIALRSSQIGITRPRPYATPRFIAKRIRTMCVWRILALRREAKDREYRVIFR